ncbi:hypothetical protein DIS24_g8808 [Lasiodiplodia hormozganensis]|uniref:Uncharacterized protein n=1 Tax=Lasiodiplodia hormozganensis TaxID=869390 RepID=A0AA39XYP6_9PEZI|nr:hypothetical protein DIS24_g8808 [Lasiodiplodia hormozganensis]
MSDDEYDVEAMAKNQIWFKVENQTGFQLAAQSCFADWGDFAEPPSSVAPYSMGSGGRAISSRSPFTGTAGMVGYRISAGSETLYLRFLGSNPYMSAKDNYSTSAVLTEDKSIGQGDYNWLYYRQEKDDSKPFNGGTLRVTSQIGQADDATALFTVTFEE